MEIDPARLVLEDKTVRESGRDISCDIYDSEGTLTNRIEFCYDDAGRLIRQLDYAGDFTAPFKEENRSYSASGKLLSVEVNFEGEPGSLETHHYDHLDRLTEVILKEFDDEEAFEVTRYHYTDTSDNHATEEVYHGAELVSRVHSVYNAEGKKTEEHHEACSKNELAFHMRYYWNNERPNNVFWEKYNEDGDFLEESRQWYDAKGNLLRSETHTDEHAESEAYYTEVYEYSPSGSCISSKHERNGSLEHEERFLLDEQDRVLRAMNSRSNYHIITCYRYESKE